MAITIRDAGKGDGALVFRFVRELAVYEKLEHLVQATAETMEEALNAPDARVHAVIAEADGSPVGLALYFYNFSTFLGRYGLFIEDLDVSPEMRGHGIGATLLKHLATKAVEKNCGRMEWAVLDWNQPSIDFYERIGGKPLNEWITYRLEGEALQSLANQA